MGKGCKTLSCLVWGWLGFGCLLLSGCAAPRFVPVPTPHELALLQHSPYVIEPPDILLIDAVRIVPRPPYRIEPLDSLAIQVFNIPPE